MWGCQFHSQCMSWMRLQEKEGPCSISFFPVKATHLPPIESDSPISTLLPWLLLIQKWTQRDSMGWETLFEPDNNPFNDVR